MVWLIPISSPTTGPGPLGSEVAVRGIRVGVEVSAAGVAVAVGLAVGVAVAVGLAVGVSVAVGLAVMVDNEPSEGVAIFTVEPGFAVPYAAPERITKQTKNVTLIITIDRETNYGEGLA